MTESNYAESSQAVTVLVLGIVGLVMCQILGPVAWIMGNAELEGIDAGRRAPENRGLAMAGKVCGMIATALIALGIAWGVFVIVLGVGAAAVSAN